MNSRLFLGDKEDIKIVEHSEVQTEREGITPTETNILFKIYLCMKGLGSNPTEKFII